MYRFLIDEDSPKGLARLLQSHGHDAIHVVDAGLSGYKDPQIAVWAKEQGRIIITRDLGFGNLLKFPLGTLPGVVLLRVSEECLASEIIDLVARFLPIIEQDELQLQGALVVLEPSQFRVRTP